MLDLDDALDENAWEMRKKIKMIVDWMIDNHPSLRQASEDLCIPKSTLHRWIHTYVKTYYPEEYSEIRHYFYLYKKYRFKPRKLWRPSDLT